MDSVDRAPASPDPSLSPCPSPCPSSRGSTPKPRNPTDISRIRAFALANVAAQAQNACFELREGLQATPFFVPLHAATKPKCQEFCDALVECRRALIMQRVRPELPVKLAAVVSLLRWTEAEANMIHRYRLKDPHAPALTPEEFAKFRLAAPDFTSLLCAAVSPYLDFGDLRGGKAPADWHLMLRASKARVFRGLGNHSLYAMVVLSFLDIMPAQLPVLQMHIDAVTAELANAPDGARMSVKLCGMEQWNEFVFATGTARAYHASARGLVGKELADVVLQLPKNGLPEHVVLTLRRELDPELQNPYEEEEDAEDIERELRGGGIVDPIPQFDWEVNVAWNNKQQRKASWMLYKGLKENDEVAQNAFLNFMSKFWADIPVRNEVRLKVINPLTGCLDCEVMPRSEAKSRFSHFVVKHETKNDKGKVLAKSVNALDFYLKNPQHPTYDMTDFRPGQKAVIYSSLPDKTLPQKDWHLTRIFNCAVPAVFFTYRNQYPPELLLPDGVMRDLNRILEDDDVVKAGISQECCEELTGKFLTTMGYRDACGQACPGLDPRKAYENLVATYSLKPPGEVFEYRWEGEEAMRKRQTFEQDCVVDGTHWDRWDKYCAMEDGAMAMLSLVLFHIYTVITDKNWDMFFIFLSFFARMLRDPGSKSPYLLYITGAQGAGKSSLMAQIGRLIFGEGILFQYMGGDVQRLTDRFNSQFECCLYALMDEATMPDNPHSADRTVQQVKSLVTDPLRNTERKHGNVTINKNLMNMVMLSNVMTMMPMQAGDRRYACNKVANWMLGVHNYNSILQPRLATKFCMVVFGQFLMSFSFLHNSAKGINFSNNPPFTPSKRACVVAHLKKPIYKYWQDLIDRPHDKRNLLEVGRAASSVAHASSKRKTPSETLLDETSITVAQAFRMAAEALHAQGVDVARLRFATMVPEEARPPGGSPIDDVSCQGTNNRLWRVCVDLGTLCQDYNATYKSAAAYLEQYSFKDQLSNFCLFATAGNYIVFPCLAACKAMFECYLEYGQVADSLDVQPNSWIRILFKQARSAKKPAQFHSQCVFCWQCTQSWKDFEKLPLARQIEYMHLDEAQSFQYRLWTHAAQQIGELPPVSKIADALAQVAKPWKHSINLFSGYPDLKRPGHSLQGYLLSDYVADQLRKAANVRLWKAAVERDGVTCKAPQAFGRDATARSVISDVRPELEHILPTYESDGLALECVQDDLSQPIISNFTATCGMPSGSPAHTDAITLVDAGAGDAPARDDAASQPAVRTVRYVSPEPSDEEDDPSIQIDLEHELGPEIELESADGGKGKRALHPRWDEHDGPDHGDREPKRVRHR
jgi:hypothetical protein